MNEQLLALHPITKVDILYCKDLLKRNLLPYDNINSKKITLYKAYLDNTLIGIAGYELYDDIVLFRSMVIQDNFRHKGYGKVLVDEMIDILKTKKVKEVYLLTTTASGFFKKLDFEVINREEAPESIKESSEFKDLCPQTAICMKKVINFD